VVRLPEPSTTLDLALRHIYPVRNPRRIAQCECPR
jgi:hypothetical protein